LLIQGRDLVAHGYKGIEIGKKLKEIRDLQLQGQLTTREQAFAFLSSSKNI